MIAHIGLIAGPFYPSEEMKDTIDEPNDSQLTFSLVIISITTVCFHINVDKQVLSFTDTLKVGILAQIGPNVGPFDQSEDADVILDEPNQRQISFKLVKINITTVDFNVMLMSR